MTTTSRERAMPFVYSSSSTELKVAAIHAAADIVSAHYKTRHADDDGERIAKTTQDVLAAICQYEPPKRDQASS